MKNDATARRFKSPTVNTEGKTVYGIIQGEPVFNPDYKWPRNLRRKGDAWVNENDEVEEA